MFNNAFIIERLSNCLSEELKDSVLVNSFSTSPHEIFFVFDNYFAFQYLLSSKGALFFEKSAETLPKRNRQPCFRELHGKRLCSVVSHKYDRSFHLEFENSALHFALYGKRAGIIEIQGNDLIRSSFGFKHTSIDYSTIEKDIHLLINRGELSREDFYTTCRFLNHEQKELLSEMGFFEKSNRLNTWEKFCQLNLYGNLKIKGEDPPELVIDFNTEGKERFFTIYTDFSRKMASWLSLADARSKLVNQIERELKILKSRVTKIQNSLQQKTKQRSYRELADLIMANLHLKPENDHLKVVDFYTHEDVDIKVKRGETLQQTAQRYYRKAKKEHLSIAEMEKQQEATNQRIEVLSDALKKVMESSNSKEILILKSELFTEVRSTKADTTLSFSTLEFEGFTIWVGKNARQNDLVLQRSSGDDIWLHARNTKGSHVVIRNPNRSSVPERVIEYAASLAAYHSKSKGESLVSVMYTPRKYVRKFKGAAAGEVKVDREEGMLVEPRKIG